MEIKLEITPSVSFSKDATPSVRICDVDADGSEMPFVNALVADIEMFAKIWQKGDIHAETR